MSNDNTSNQTVREETEALLKKYSENIGKQESFKNEVGKFAKNAFEWSEEIRKSFLRPNKRAVAGTGQSYVENKTIDELIKDDNWKKIAKIINPFKDSNDIKSDAFKNFYNGLVEEIGRYQKTIPTAAIRAMAIMLRPKDFCRFVNDKKLKKTLEVCKIELCDDWFEMNCAIMKACMAACDNDEYKAGAIPWEVYANHAKYEMFAENLKIQKNIILTGAPGTGKTYLANKIAETIIGSKNKEDKIAFVQFHPSYDYTDFVEGLRPVGANDFQHKDGCFKAFCKKAVGKPNEKYVFIIDEINRGEISKIFGELFFSIDPEYRYKKDNNKENIIVKTQYQDLIKEDNDVYKNGFYLPDNVYIIGTMNDIDRSVESMDFAFRRRFAFYEITADDSQDMLKGLDTKVCDVMDAINTTLVKECGLTEAYQIGGSYFLKLKSLCKSATAIKPSEFEELWNIYLQGTLFEYFRGEPDAPEKMKKLREAYYKAVNNNA